MRRLELLRSLSPVQCAYMCCFIYHGKYASIDDGVAERISGSAAVQPIRRSEIPQEC